MGDEVFLCREERGEAYLLGNVGPLIKGNVGVDGHDAVEAHLLRSASEGVPLDVVVCVRIDLAELPEPRKLVALHGCGALLCLGAQVALDGLQAALCLDVAARHV